MSSANKRRKLKNSACNSFSTDVAFASASLLSDVPLTYSNTEGAGRLKEKEKEREREGNA